MIYLRNKIKVQILCISRADVRKHEYGIPIRIRPNLKRLDEQTKPNLKRLNNLAKLAVTLP